MSSKIFLFCLACWGSMLAQPVLAQRERRDTAGTGSVDIVSAFKPLLRDPVKIQFAPQPPQADTTRPKLIYRIPSQELSITYQPGTLKPLAYQADSNRGFAAAQYLKLGYGNLRNPYASLAIELGKHNPIHIYADHRAASGKLAFQDYSLSSIRVHGQLPSGTRVLGRRFYRPRVWQPINMDWMPAVPRCRWIRFVKAFIELGSNSDTGPYNPLNQDFNWIRLLALIMWAIGLATKTFLLTSSSPFGMRSTISFRCRYWAQPLGDRSGMRIVPPAPTRYIV